MGHLPRPFFIFEAESAQAVRFCIGFWNEKGRGGRISWQTSMKLAFGYLSFAEFRRSIPAETTIFGTNPRFHGNSDFLLARESSKTFNG